MKTKFPFEHVVKYDTQEIWVTNIGCITAMGLSQVVEKYYPGYKGKIANKENFEKLKNQLIN